MPDTSLNPDFLSVTDHEFWTNPNWSEGTWMEVAVTSPQNFFPSIMSSPAMSTLSPTLSAPSPDMSAPSPNTFISSPDSSIFSLNTSFYSPSPSMSISSPGMSISSPSMCMNSRQDISSPETSYYEISSPEPSPNSNLGQKIRTPKVKRERTRVNNTKAPNIVHWTAQQVCDPRLNDIITWDSYEEGRFIIRDQKKLALLWGKSKGKNMDFANYSRALRYHYKNSKNKELVAVSKKLIYRFSEDFMNSFVRKLNN